MTNVDLNVTKYVVRNGVVKVSEKDVLKFDTAYNVLSPKSGKFKEFHFECSTGPEFDPKTEWVYKSAEGFHFHICNDRAMTGQAASAYLKAKTLN